MDLPYSVRSEFLAPCEGAIRQGRAELSSGGIVNIAFDKAGGYEGRITVIIRDGDRSFFGSDWENKDVTRFPVRIRAAATALLNCGFIGRFFVTHTDGMMEIMRA